MSACATYGCLISNKVGDDQCNQWAVRHAECRVCGHWWIAVFPVCIAEDLRCAKCDACAIELEIVEPPDGQEAATE
jgi:hypothetical protein